MPAILGRSNQLLQGPLVKFEVNPQKVEDLLATPEALPAAEPESPQVTFDLSALVPGVTLTTVKGALSWKWVAMVYAAGQNLSGVNQTINTRISKNGVSAYTSNYSVSNNAYYTFSYRLFDVTLTDVLTIKLWSTAEGCNWDYKALILLPTRPMLHKPGELLVPLKSIRTQYYSLTLGNPTISANGSVYAYYDIWGTESNYLKPILCVFMEVLATTPHLWPV